MRAISEIWQTDRGALIRVRRARLLGRLLGLIAAPMPGRGEALLLAGCRSVHSVGMTQTIDVVFSDRGGRVLAVRALQPCRIAGCRDAADTFEFAIGQAAALEIRPGSTLSFLARTQAEASAVGAIAVRSKPRPQAVPTSE
ncbi:MAG: DUF192 domain-containing protein [Solirubrobacterales bacterium]